MTCTTAVEGVNVFLWCGTSLLNNLVFLLWDGMHDGFFSVDMSDN